MNRWHQHYLRGDYHNQDPKALYQARRDLRLTGRTSSGPTRPGGRRWRTTTSA